MGNDIKFAVKVLCTTIIQPYPVRLDRSLRKTLYGWSSVIKLSAYKSLSQVSVKQTILKELFDKLHKTP